jgi:exodeoxyribonuclease V beta subunit
VTTPLPYDVCGPLPTGVTLLEASAGTGKTFTIAALTARYVAEGMPLDEVLLVTFGRMATGELRARVRDRLVSVEAGLARARVGVAPAAADEVLMHLCAVPDDELVTRQARLTRALADFDAATITTTHGFCQQMLSGIGVAGDVDRDLTFVEDLTGLVDEVVDDLYLRKFAGRSPIDGFDLTLARRIGHDVVGQPAAAIVPQGQPEQSVAAMRYRLAQAVRDEVERRKRRMRVLTYDDLQTRLAAALRDPHATDRLRDRFRVVMVDEFQDTDPVQWDIVRTAFGDGATTLVLIGDPKQAIYAFRGADVHTYLTAASDAGTVATLDRNWRSDRALVDAYDALFDGLMLGHPGIEYRTVQAAEAHREAGLRGAPHDAALRVRVVHRDEGRVELTRAGWASNATARAEVAADLAADVVELLSSGAELVARDGRGAEVASELVGPGDIAVLVATHRHAALVRDAFAGVGVPAVIAGAGSVFGTPVAKEWLALLEALERPSSIGRVHAAALCSFVGWSVERVATADDAAWEDVYVRLHEWSAVLRTRGVASLLESLMRSERLPARLLSREDGERELTDLRHIGQLLHQEATTERFGVTALTAWLRARVREAADDVHDEDRSRRLESDSGAVQVLTIHRCKGLEFPIVYCPFLWQPPYMPDEQLPVFHDAAAGDQRAIDVGGPAHAGFADHQARHVAEVQGEALRLAYVAMTRARHQTILHWASTFDSRESSLARLLFAAELAPSDIRLARPPHERAVIARLEAIATNAPGTTSIERAAGARGVSWEPPVAAARRLAVRPFDRGFDLAWRRASYSGLTSGANETGVASEAEPTSTTDEDIDVGGSAPAAPAIDPQEGLRGVELPLGGMPRGARVGTLVHAVLEHTDFAAPDLDAEVGRALADQIKWNPTGIGSVDSFTTGLAQALDTPLGPMVGDIRLRDIPTSDRLDELTFDLPLVGGDIPVASLDVGAIADLFERHLAPDEPLAGYAVRLRDPLLDQRIRGYLTGSIDAVLRVPGNGAVRRFAVVDYKSNWLAVDGDPISAWDYRPAALAAAMEHAHYPLQALFYVVALHRYLRWRIVDYDPDVHLAGVLYLFVRGMIGATTPVVDGTPCGVFAWRPSSALVIAASDLLDRGTGADRG